MAIKQNKKYRKLNDYVHVRLRPNLNGGSTEPHTQALLHYDGQSLTIKEFTWVPALYVAFKEIIDNSLDAMIDSGVGNLLKVIYDEETLTFTIEDNAPGLPIGEIKELGKGPAASILVSELRAGSNFDERGQIAGANGLGAACTNFTSAWFTIDVYNKDKRLKQQWKEGTYKGKDTHKTSGPNVIRGSKNKHGTTISYSPSTKVYPNLILPSDFILGRMWDIAVANPNIKIYYNDEWLKPKHKSNSVTKTYFSNISVSKITLKDKTFSSEYWMVQDFSDAETIHSLVNNNPAFEGGSHIDAFKAGIFPPMLEYLNKQIKKEKLEVTRADITKGMLLFNITRMDAPIFNSPVKSKLISNVKPSIMAGVNKVDISVFFRQNPNFLAAILNNCRLRNASKDERELKKQQKSVSHTRIHKLTDAVGQNRSKCILFLGEGDSALNGMLNVRNPELHGALPLRGKILNVNGVSNSDIMSSETLKDIMGAIGLKLNSPADREALRYGSIYIATDEDQDGKNISCLIISFLFTHWPELFRTGSPFVYKFCTPFLIMEKRSTRKYIYGGKEYDTYLKHKNKWKSWSTTRAKGLGTLEEIDWVHVLDNPRLISIIDDGNIAGTLDLIFNKHLSDERKIWLS